MQRLYRLAEGSLGDVPTPPDQFGAAAMALRRITHRTIASVTTALESFAYNVAVARMYELAAAIGEADKAPSDTGTSYARREAVEIAARLVAPMMPHLAEEIFSRLHRTRGLLAQAAWPEADPSLVAAQSVTIAVQVMGKLRATIEAAPGESADTVIAAAAAEPNVARLLEGKRVVKRIHVPDRIVNFVVAG